MSDEMIWSTALTIPTFEDVQNREEKELRQAVDAFAKKYAHLKIKLIVEETYEPTAKPLDCVGTTDGKGKSDYREPNGYAFEKSEPMEGFIQAINGSLVWRCADGKEISLCELAREPVSLEKCTKALLNWRICGSKDHKCEQIEHHWRSWTGEVKAVLEAAGVKYE